MQRSNIQITHASLRTVADELSKLRFAALKAPTIACDRAAEPLADLRELKQSFVRDLSSLCVRLDDGRLLLKPLYRALLEFCNNNTIVPELLLRKVTIEGAVIVEGQFDYCGLKTLKGLDTVWSLRRLSLFSNRAVCSLIGIPTQSIEWIDASCCDLIGDLSALAPATNLRYLNVDGNRGLTSLAGMPQQMIQEVYAGQCGLNGDHTFLATAPNLQKLHLELNPKKLSIDRRRFNPQAQIQL